MYRFTGYEGLLCFGKQKIYRFVLGEKKYPIKTNEKDFGWKTWLNEMTNETRKSRKTATFNHPGTVTLWPWRESSGDWPQRRKFLSAFSTVAKRFVGHFQRWVNEWEGNKNAGRWSCGKGAFGTVINWATMSTQLGKPYRSPEDGEKKKMVEKKNASSAHVHFVNIFVFLPSNTMVSVWSKRSETVISMDLWGHRCRIWWQNAPRYPTLCSHCDTEREEVEAHLSWRRNTESESDIKWLLIRSNMRPSGWSQTPAECCQTHTHKQRRENPFSAIFAL